MDYGMKTYNDFNKAVLSYQKHIDECISTEQVDNLGKMLTLAYLNFKPNYKHEPIMAAQKLEYLLNKGELKCLTLAY